MVVYSYIGNVRYGVTYVSPSYGVMCLVSRRPRHSEYLEPCGNGRYSSGHAVRLFFFEPDIGPTRKLSCTLCTGIPYNAVLSKNASLAAVAGSCPTWDNVEQCETLWDMDRVSHGLLASGSLCIVLVANLQAGRSPVLQPCLAWNVPNETPDALVNYGGQRAVLTSGTYIM